jgi:hypothetical protein
MDNRTWRRLSLCFPQHLSELPDGKSAYYAWRKNNGVQTSTKSFTAICFCWNGDGLEEDGVDDGMSNDEAFMLFTAMTKILLE